MGAGLGSGVRGKDAVSVWTGACVAGGAGSSGGERCGTLGGGWGSLMGMKRRSGGDSGLASPGRMVGPSPSEGTPRTTALAKGRWGLRSGLPGAAVGLFGWGPRGEGLSLAVGVGSWPHVGAAPLTGLWMSLGESPPEGRGARAERHPGARGAAPQSQMLLPSGCSSLRPKFTAIS